MKISKRDRQALNDILGRLEKAEKFIKSDKVMITYNGHPEMNKEIGSDLNYLYTAKTNLQNLLNEEQ